MTKLQGLHEALCAGPSQLSWTQTAKPPRHLQPGTMRLQRRKTCAALMNHLVGLLDRGLLNPLLGSNGLLSNQLARERTPAYGLAFGSLASWIRRLQYGPEPRELGMRLGSPQHHVESDGKKPTHASGWAWLFSAPLNARASLPAALIDSSASLSTCSSTFHVSFKIGRYTASSPSPTLRETRLAVETVCMARIEVHLYAISCI